MNAMVGSDDSQHKGDMPTYGAYKQMYVSIPTPRAESTKKCVAERFCALRISYILLRATAIY